MLARISSAALLAAAVALGGCCPTAIKPTGPLLAAQPASVHVAAINHKADLIETLRARGRVQIKWTDSKGNPHNETADGVLIIRQRNLPGGEPVLKWANEVVLFGRVASQDIFELGENSTHYWMAVRVDPKTAIVGSKRSPHDFAPNPDLPFRAGKVPEILGIAPISPGDEPLVTTNLDSVDVLVVRRASRPGVAADHAVDRALSFSRYGAGDLETVRLYDRSGIIEGSATLSDYREVPTAPVNIDAPAGADKRSISDVRLPFRIEIIYPASKAQVILNIETYELGIPLKDIAFKLPDFAKQGLKVETTPH